MNVNNLEVLPLFKAVGEGLLNQQVTVAEQQEAGLFLTGALTLTRNQRACINAE